MKRRLSTVLAADLVGYSRLMAADEEGVIVRLRNARDEIVAPAVSAFDGRIFKVIADGFLAEFASPVSAVRAALRVQREMATHGRLDADDERLRFRIGVHLGDVVVDGNDLLGDAVNTAARLESIAPEGGIVISRAVMEQARGKIDEAMTPFGPQFLKNLPESVDVFRVEIAAGMEAASIGVVSDSRPRLLIAEFGWFGDASGIEALARGIAEDVAGALSRTVIVLRRDGSGESAALTAAQAARATHLLEGSVRGNGLRVRLVATLRAVPGGEIVWSRRLDGLMEDLFDLQDQLAIAVAQETGAELSDETFGLTLRKTGTRNLDAWRCFAEALPDLNDLYNAARRERAAASVERAITLDPEFAAAWAAKTNVAYAEHRLTGDTQAVAACRAAAERA